MIPLKQRTISQPEFFKLCANHDKGNPLSLSVEGREPSFDHGVVHLTLRRDEVTHFTGIGLMAVSLESEGGGARATNALKTLREWLRDYQEAAA